MTNSNSTLQLSWDEAIGIMQKCKHIGNIGWIIAKRMKIPNYLVWEKALDVKYGMELVSILKQAIRMRKRPRYVVFNRRGNVSATW